MAARFIGLAPFNPNNFLHYFRMTKKEARISMRHKRHELSAIDIEKKNDLLLLSFQRLPLPYLNCVHSYLASERLREPDTSLILRYLQFRFPELKIAAPKVDIQSQTMTHFLITEGDRLEENIYGIDEPASGTSISPAEIDLVIVPLLAFDSEGNRVGYGKGYYDRFLSECRPDTIKIGLSFFEPVNRIDDVDSFDIRLNYCCTPGQIYSW